ncbi:MAG: pyridoxine 5'-phosphate synthase [Planctomycetota bacterium]
MSGTALSVNVNKVALLRNQRAGQTPSVVGFSRAALAAGAAGVTVHPRPDERHIRAADVGQLAALLREPAWADREFNIEGNPALGDWMGLVRAARPDQATLVPDSEGQSTSDHGFDLAQDAGAVAPIVAELKSLGVRVSLFMDPEPGAMRLAREVGAERVELYTEPYAVAFGGPEQSGVVARYAESAQAAAEAGLGVNAGHDLSLENLGLFARAVSPLSEVSIGHALIAECLHLGVGEVVRQYNALCAAGVAP